VGAGVEAFAVSVDPHEPQNLAFGLSMAPQEGQLVGTLGVDAGAGAEAFAVRVVPHPPQNLASGFKVAPQEGQRWMEGSPVGAPHPPQNFTPGLFSCSQRAHFIN